MKNLSNKEKIKRLIIVRENLKPDHFFSYMCIVYNHYYNNDLFLDIPEILQFKPTHVDYSFLNDAWYNNDESSIIERKHIINLTINYINNLG